MKYAGRKIKNVEMSIAFLMLADAVTPIKIPSQINAPNVIIGIK